MENPNIRAKKNIRAYYRKRNSMKALRDIGKIIKNILYIILLICVSPITYPLSKLVKRYKK